MLPRCIFLSPFFLFHRLNGNIMSRITGTKQAQRHCPLTGFMSCVCFVGREKEGGALVSCWFQRVEESWKLPDWRHKDLHFSVSLHPAPHTCFAECKTLFHVQGVPFKLQPTIIMRYSIKRNRKQVPSPSRAIDSPNVPTCARVKVTLVPRLLLASVTQKLCRPGRGVFTNGTCVNPRTLLRIQIVCCST
jgi:hypothetical protein